MKSKLVGLLYLVVGALMLGAFILSMLMFFGDGEDSFLVGGIMSLFFGIYSLMLGSGLRSRKKWSWYAGLITLALALVGNLITMVVNFSLGLVVPILLEIVSLYAIYADKGEFPIGPPSGSVSPQASVTQVESSPQPSQQSSNEVRQNPTQDLSIHTFNSSPDQKGQQNNQS